MAAKVEALAGFGFTAAQIARMLRIGVDDLSACYEEELDCGQLKANARVAESLYRKALGEGREAVTAAIFWLKAKAHWRETSIHEVSGLDGGPIETIEHEPVEIAKALLLVLNRRMDEAD